MVDAHLLLGFSQAVPLVSSTSGGLFDRHMLEITTIKPFFDKDCVGIPRTPHQSVVINRGVFMLFLWEKPSKLPPGVVRLLDLKRGMLLKPVCISSCIGCLVGFGSASKMLNGCVR